MIFQSQYRNYFYLIQNYNGAGTYITASVTENQISNNFTTIKNKSLTSCHSLEEHTLNARSLTVKKVNIPEKNILTQYLPVTLHCLEKETPKQTCSLLEEVILEQDNSSAKDAERSIINDTEQSATNAKLILRLNTLTPLLTTGITLNDINYNTNDTFDNLHTYWPIRDVHYENVFD